MKRVALAASMVFGQLFGTSAFAAGDHGSEAEAQDMVKRAVALIHKLGPEDAYKTFRDNPGTAFNDKDLFPFVYDYNGNGLVQPKNKRMEGKNMIALKDVDGVPFVKNMIDIVKLKKKGWTSTYRFPNPVTKELATNKTYCEDAGGDTLVCVGVYVNDGAK
ncbi:cache domain-containing protein [Undibacterium terreum]|uniref:Single Cache domain-containing protein n=1 Tax=Undibacterium terreum TaxID=1224302 RepID=A0A916V1J9_9BURK|nr:cache domain-containing protein [Undibacterium terreum]GGD00500.1 hypothetical protein GCM10011396_55090 [Undibacterium terreum]